MIWVRRNCCQIYKIKLKKKTRETCGVWLGKRKYTYLYLSKYKLRDIKFGVFVEVREGNSRSTSLSSLEGRKETKEETKIDRQKEVTVGVWWSRDGLYRCCRQIHYWLHTIGHELDWERLLDCYKHVSAAV